MSWAWNRWPRQRPFTSALKRPANAPATAQSTPQPTPLVGRAAELGQLFTWLHDPARRLITLAGPGGSGKTRLALAAASDQAYAFLDGVVFIPLAEITSGAGLAPAIAAALGLTLAVPLKNSPSCSTTCATKRCCCCWIM
jgi:hypothetical protein